MSAHDPLCPVSPAEQLEPAKCWRCKLVREARRDGIRRALDVVDQGGRAAGQLRALLEES